MNTRWNSKYGASMERDCGEAWAKTLFSEPPGLVAEVDRVLMLSFVCPLRHLLCAHLSRKNTVIAPLNQYIPRERPCP
jgi:hypothetical protein